MKIVESAVRQIEITDVRGLDPIRVILSDLGPGQGRINIECYGQAWSCFWGSMGGTISDFFTWCDKHYLAGKLSNIPSEIYTPDGLKEMLKRELLNERRRGLVSGWYARQRYETIEELNLPDTEEQLWSVARDMENLIGEEWWYRIPKKQNPDYEYLTRIIETVKDALLSAKGGAA